MNPTTQTIIQLLLYVVFLGIACYWLRRENKYLKSQLQVIKDFVEIFDVGKVKDWVEFSEETIRKKAQAFVREEKEKMNEEIQNTIKSRKHTEEYLDEVIGDSMGMIFGLVTHIPRRDRAHAIRLIEQSMEGSYGSYALMIFHALKERDHLMDIPSPTENFLAMCLEHHRLQKQ